MTTTDPHILHLIARSGLAEDDLLSFVEGDLGADRAAAVVRVLAEHPELSSLLMEMRSDRSELGQELEFELVAAEPDASLVGAAVHQGVTGELDPAFAARFEATGRQHGGGMPRMRPTRVRRARRLRFPARAAGTLLAACIIGGFLGAVYFAWPSTPMPPAVPGLASSGAEATTDSEPIPAIAPGETEPDALIADAGGFDEPVPDWGPTMSIQTPAAALEAALEGRLVIRLYSPDGAAGRRLVESITMAPSVSRVAVLEGQLTDVEASRIAGSIPVPTGPVYAGDPEDVELRPQPQDGRASWVYMIEVEPTERGMSLLLAGLSRRPGVLVELLRSGAPVTTPGSADDVSWFRSPSRDWTRRVAAPIVVQSNDLAR